MTFFDIKPGIRTMWTASKMELTPQVGDRFSLIHKGKPASFATVIAAWQTDPQFRIWFNDLLAQAPWPAFRWETPAITASTIARPFECVVLESPELESHPDPEAFSEHSVTGKPVVRFTNLGGDAELIVPCPIAQPSAYPHLATFTREAPETQRQALWEAVGHGLARRIQSRLVWLSTAGAGVPWLHVRLDSRPKYYAYAAYRENPLESRARG